MMVMMVYAVAEMMMAKAAIVAMRMSVSEAAVVKITLFSYFLSPAQFTDIHFFLMAPCNCILGSFLDDDGVEVMRLVLEHST